MAETSGIPGTPTRRALVTGAGAVGLAAALAACGGSDDTPSSSQDAATPSKDSTSSSPSDAPGSGGGTELAKTSDIPEGGGTIFKDQKVVVTQPSSGEFKAFSAVCTHRGCPVTDVSDGTINCVCHNSKFSIADGSVTAGPATEPLPTVKVSIEGSSIRSLQM